MLKQRSAATGIHEAAVASRGWVELKWLRGTGVTK